MTNAAPSPNKDSWNTQTSARWPHAYLMHTVHNDLSDRANCDSSFQIDKRGREQTEQVPQIIAREPDIVCERIDSMHDDDLQVGENSQQVDADPV
jgi:hypothetical protein